MALWDGRFDGEPSQLMQEYGESLTVDLQMWAEDIEGSKAHAQMLFEVGLLSESEKNQILQGLAKVAEAAWTGAPTVILNNPSKSGAGAGSREYWSLTKEYHERVQEMRRQFGVTEHPRLLLEKQGRAF